MNIQTFFNYHLTENKDKENFFVNNTNKIAYNIIINNSFEQNLILYGESKSGKSHLINVWTKLNSAILFDNNNFDKIINKKNNVAIDDLNRVYYYSIAPNMLISLHPEYVMYHTVWPDGVDKCIVNCSWLFNKDVIKSKKYNTADAVNFWDTTNKQDWHISELSQLGIQSKKYSPAPYSGQESLLAAFDQYYKASLKG